MSKANHLTGLKLAGLAGSLFLVPIGAALAQDAQQALPAAAPVAQECSGLSCLFRSRSAPPAPVASAPAEAQPAAADVADAPASDGKAKAKPKPKPVHVVTIAADPAEAPRLEALAAALPRTKIRIVKTGEGTKPNAKGADFAVATTLDNREQGDKARLFTEQMHIVAGGSVHSVAELQDKVVSFGPDKGETQVAARKAFEALGVRVRETPLDLDNALDGLATGDVDAVVVLAPQPVDRLVRLKGPGLHLVAWPEGGQVPDGASAVTIDMARYPGLAGDKAPIRAVGVEAVLNPGAKRTMDPAAKAFLTALTQHSAALSKRGFDLIRADAEERSGRRVASAEKR